ncbi:type I protein arginine methyltransferase [Paragonimus westermani]|uniref:type I protein arginine methyltransferase n=1 Tax=Paragonimus westermani TaxID=34504 RepID=A0A5J4NPZ6_9TREM|nr:type I protein arginine methyltransferase [Paragonimus westermani]
MASFSNVELRLFEESSFTCRTLGVLLTLNVDNNRLVFFRHSEVVKEIALGPNVSVSRLSMKIAGITVKKDVTERALASYFVGFDSSKDLLNFLTCMKACNTSLTGYGSDLIISSFDKRTDSWSAVQYFQFYSYLSQQQNMMQDYVRTSTYQRAILANAVDFRGKVVLDVGAGSGILSFFAIQAGATRVYAVEASNMAVHCNTLVQANKLAGRIVVISGKIEEVTLPEPVDIIISEPMGYMLYNERMLETYVHARKFLAPRLRQLSSSKQCSRKRRSCQTNQEMISAPSEQLVDGDQLSGDEDNEVSDRFDSDENEGIGDLKTQNQADVEGPAKWSNRAIPSPGIMFPTVANLYIVPFSDEALFAEQYAKANFWYQQSFHGMDLTALRSAAVSEYFNQPIVDTFDIGLCPAMPCVHKVDFRTVSEAQLTSIDIPLHFQISTCSTITNSLDLKNPHFRYNGYPPAPPPGSHIRSPTETYYASLCLSQQHQQQVQVQPEPVTDWIAPAVSSIGSSAQTVVAPLFAVAAPNRVGANFFAVNNVTMTEGQLSHHQQQQSMQLSPQPMFNAISAPSNTTVVPVLSPSHPVSLDAISLTCGGSATCGAVPSTLFNPTASYMIGVENSPSNGNPSNGWRPG